MTRLIPWLRFGVLILGVAGAVVAATLYSFNHFDDVENRFAGACAPVTGIAGPEDIQIDQSRGEAYISSLNRRAGPDARGAVFAFSIDDPLASAGWRDRTRGVPAEFRPLGLSYFEEGDSRRLFVVNDAARAVEIYDVLENGDLSFVESLTERRLTSPNNIVAVGPRAFYLTNDVEVGRDGPLGDLHFLARIASGKIMYFNGQTWRVAAEGLRYANGIALSPDGTRLYAAETAGEALQIYDRDLDTGVLSSAGEIKLGASPDNLTTDWDGNIWIGALPKPLMIPAHAADSETPAASMSIRIRQTPTGLGPPEIVYANDGTEISASTVAAASGRRLLIGALFEEKFLLCQMAPNAS